MTNLDRPCDEKCPIAPPESQWVCSFCGTITHNCGECRKCQREFEHRHDTGDGR